MVDRDDADEFGSPLPAADDTGSGRYAPSAEVPAEPQPTEELPPASQEGLGRAAQGESPPKVDSPPSALSSDQVAAMAKVVEDLNSCQKSVECCIEYGEI